MIRTVLVVLVCAAALAAGNPAAGVKEWRWTPRHATVSPNVMALPFNKFMKTFTPKIRIPGTKAVDGCGPTQAENRIVGGDEATPNSYPWQVALFIDDIYFCGGSIINEEWILTAAHCMDGAGFVEVVAGAHNIRDEEPSQVSMISTDFFVHEDWGSILLRNDLSLIRLPQPLSWTAEIAPVCLPSYSATELSAGTLVNPSGWGRPSDNDNSISDVLRQVTVPIMGNPDCEAVYGSTITDDIICIDSTGGVGTCNGDSGGPMNYVDGGVTYTRGIVSFGSSTGCETGYPDGFTRVINYLDWIETNTGIAVDP